MCLKCGALQCHTTPSAITIRRMGGLFCRYCKRETVEESVELSSNYVRAMHYLRSRFSYDRHGSKTQVSSYVVSGEGACLATSPLLQTKSYFEIRIKRSGEFCIGVSQEGKRDSLDGHLHKRPDSWVLHVTTDGVFKENTVIGVSYDMSSVRPELRFWHEGKEIASARKTNIAGEVFPAVSVSDGCILEANFGQDKFVHPPHGFGGVMQTMDII